MKKIVLAAAAVPALAILAAAAVPNTAHGDAFSNVRKAYSPAHGSNGSTLGDGPPVGGAFNRKWRATHPLGKKELFKRNRIHAEIWLWTGRDGYGNNPINAMADGIFKRLEEGADPNIRDYRDMTPLHRAVMVDKTPTDAITAAISAIIQGGGNPNLPARNAKGTPLHWAAATNPNRKIIAALIALGANPNARDAFSATPLHIAALMNPKPAGVMRELLARKADPKVRDKGGNFPFDYAENRKALQGTDVYRTLKAAAGR